MDLFRVGGQCGLKPDEVLDLSLDVFAAYIAGYGDRLFDQQLLAVQNGYWSGYYGSRSKRPKPLEAVLSTMLKKRERQERRGKAPAPDVDVAAFLEHERRFKEHMNS